MVYLNLNQFKYEQIEGLEMNLNDLEQTTMRISNLSKELRALLPGLENGRSDVIICGLYWLKSLLERLHVESFKISTAGIRFCLLYPSSLQRNLMRLNKFISSCGIASRRAADTLILEGRVMVNNEVVKELGSQVSLHPILF
jgi:exopolyphosphatase/pppGpp-phosphohydrolase